MLLCSCRRYGRRHEPAVDHFQGNAAASVMASGSLRTRAGVQASEFHCEAMDLDLYLLIPQTSDHLFNLEQESTVTLLTARCELKGQAQIISRGIPDLKLDLLREPGAAWCALVRVEISQVQIRSEQGWGNIV